MRRPKLKPTAHLDAKTLVPASVLLQRLHDEAPTDQVTLGWLMGRLHKRSFGLIMLLLAVVAIAPGVSIVAGLLLMIPAFQMVAGQHMPVLRAVRPLPTRHLAALVQRAVPVLRYLEKFIHPLAHSARCDQAPRRRRRRAAEHHLTVHSDPSEQRRPCPRDRSDLAGLSRGGRAPAVDSPAGQRHRTGGRVCGGLGNDPRREMDLRPLVAHRGV
jgi:Exopolysaccharide synthesis, ExoD